MQFAKIFRFSFFLVVFAFASTRDAHAEIIRSFHSDVRLRADTSLDVTETIVMDFEGSQRHGIYRKIPVVYDRIGGTYSLYLQVLEVTQDGASAQYSQSRQGRDLSLRVGDPDRTISGRHTYVFRYHVRRAVNFFDGEPEVYWNATGNEWPFAMESATARFFAPPNVSIENLRADCFVGPPGSEARGDIRKEGGNLLFSTRSLAPGDGLTLVVRAPAGSVVPPTALQNVLWFLADWWPLLLFPLVTASVLFTTWRRIGRDVDGGQAVGVEWNPPQELSPAEVGTLLDERCDMQDIVATLVDLAARGYLVIQETETQKFLFLSNKDYTFIRTRAENDGALDKTLAAHERKFLVGLFGSAQAESGSERVTLSSLKNNFYAHLPGIRESIYGQMTAKHLFSSNPETTRQKYLGTGFAMIFFGAFAGFGGGFFGTISYGLGLAISGAFVLLCARAMPAKTAKGSRLLRECRGFQRFVQMAEKERIRVLAQDDPTIFGRLLPYAMVMGVADQWAEKFQGLMTQPPDWYVGPGGINTFSTHSFVHSLGSGMNTMGSTFSSAPQSTAGSGGSGFSGGGSGGGFGGGGGGSW